MKNRTVALIWLVFWGALLGYLYYSHERETESERQRRQEQLQIQQAISDMTERHHAVADWQGSLDDYRVGPIYTIEVESLLVRDDGRPILFFAEVSDVRRRGDRYILSAVTNVNISAKLRLNLEADSHQVEKVIRQRTSTVESYAIVAKISSIKKAGIEQQAMNEGEAAIIEAGSDVFFAEGRCIEMHFAGSYGFTRRLGLGR